MNRAPHLDAVVIPCRDLARQRGFYERILEGAAVEARATVGEIADTLRAIFGEYREVGLDA